ncbi:MAG: hypothetical protein JSR85_00130 [Proteobacteria bacterium]|nr:hypothetical protein [Pseudomonadota bacterium]
MRFLFHFMLWLGIASSLSGCFSFQGTREDVGFTGPMLEGTWVPDCE